MSMHVAIIMDGNGRWATGQGRRREWGHRRGAEAVRRVVRAAPDLGIDALTLYAFSSDNWSRPAAEVGLLFRLFERYLGREAAELKENGVALRVVGRRDRLSPQLVAAIERAESETRGGQRMTLRVAVDYSSRHALLEAVRNVAAQHGLAADRPDLSAALGRAMHAGGPSPDVDLLIRTGGEKRLSDFLLWECAYAELLFTPKMWPDYTGEDLAAAIREYASRDRRFGKVKLAG
ncbi:MAG: polyprenyl diphosphate synthase [Gemmatimonadota bacterium]|nr:polyprenyl diphosphate synthase [Gemmatimonadota bacterium]MDH3421658.1 polyprenyl diphosphate synthase [Gemmatimonadota bacterium]